MADNFDVVQVSNQLYQTLESNDSNGLSWGSVDPAFDGAYASAVGLEQGGDFDFSKYATDEEGFVDVDGVGDLVADIIQELPMFEGNESQRAEFQDALFGLLAENDNDSSLF